MARNLAAMKGTSALVRYGGAALLVFAALAIISIPVIGKGLGTVLFVAVVLSAWLWGLGPGLFATLLVEFIAIIIVVQIEHSLSLQKVLEVLSFLGLGIAITLVVEALHSARRREQAGRHWLSAVLTSIGDAVIATDDRGRVLFINPVAESLCGWSWCRGRRPPARRGLPHRQRADARASREPGGTSARRRLGGRTGEPHDADRARRHRAAHRRQRRAHPGAGGAVEGVVLVFRDVTERRLAEARAADEAPPQGRVPGHAGPRAAQPPGGDRQFRTAPGAARRRGVP